MNNTALTEVETASEAARLAIIARDAIENCFSPEWKAAHAAAAVACRAKKAAYDRAYACGALARPYWA